MRAGSPGGPGPRVVIVGGGFAGLAAARALRGTEAEVVLIDKHNHHLFQPLLYQVATAALSPANIAEPIRRILNAQANCSVVMAEVTAIDTASGTIRVGGQPYAYDYLVLATGALTNYFGHNAWCKNAPGLKTIDEAIDVRCRFLLAFEQAEIESDPRAQRAALTFAIVGAGPTGVEMAGAIAEISRMTLRRDFRRLDTASVRVILIDLADRVLGTFAPALSARARRDLEALGVELLLGTRVVGVDERGLTAETAGGRVRIEANNVVWAAGVKASPLGACLGAELDSSGRVIVGDDLTPSGLPKVFVAGDLARRVDPRTGEPVPGVAQGAIQMGRFVGRTLAAEINALGRGRSAPARGVFAYDDKGQMATIGRNRAVAQIRGLRLGGVLAFLIWAFIHVLALIGFRRRLIVLAEWIWIYFFAVRGVRLITGDERVPKPVKPPPDPRLGSPPEA